MLAMIESAIKVYLQNTGIKNLAGLDISEITINELRNWHRGTACDVVINAGNHEIYNNEIRQTVDITVFMLTELPHDILERRHRAYSLVQSVISLLARRTFELPIQPLMPTSFSDMTTESLSSIGVAAWQINFSTDFTLELLPEEEAEDLLKLTLNYTTGGIDEIAVD